MGVVLLPMAAALAHAQGTDATGVGATGADATTTADGYTTNPKFLAAVKQGRKMEGERQLLYAIDAYKKAIHLSNGQCVPCLNALYGVQIKAENFKDAIATAQQMETVATTPMVKSVAAYDRGRAIVAKGGDKPKPEQLEKAHAAFQEALEQDRQNLAALFNDAQVLERLGETDQARKDFQQCLSGISPTNPAWLRVKHFAENPALSLEKLAPAFLVTALDGSKFNLDAMGGRVVLIDFWATWCGPCNEELPHLKKIAQEFAGQPFVMISVSADQDAAVWKNFVLKHEMTWVQYRDADHKLADAFSVTAIPSYFIIDSDGVLTSEMMGEGANVQGKLKKLIARAQEAKQQAEHAQGLGSGSGPEATTASHPDQP